MLAFIDLEVNIKSKRIMDIGCLKENGERFHSENLFKLIKFTKNVDYFIGHNIVNHDYHFLKQTQFKKYITPKSLIDTLFLSTLLFPEKPYHALVKDDKLNTDSINNPLNDASNTQKLFFDVVEAFSKLDQDIQEIYYTLLNLIDGFNGFFKYLKFDRKINNLESLIQQKFHGRICQNSRLNQMISDHPMELAYALALINTNDVTSLLPPWVVKSYSYVETILLELRNTPCYQGCDYCNHHLSATFGLKKYFGFDSFRAFEGVPLQENAVNASLDNKSLITVFPTGGGKSLTFQLPAIMSRENSRGLTVVISPLQSLMKDQVDNLEDINITAAVTINGLLDPIQRAEAIKRVADGSASILYIAPESLRSKTIEQLLLGRQIIRFVIDEAHCFSTWGHDFRVDYLYIGEFIKNIQEKKHLSFKIPVSCFTATAKQNVIDDIETYFKEKLDIDMLVFRTNSQRKNLKYKVYEIEDEDQKYSFMRRLIEQENCPTIVYCSRRKIVVDVYKRLKDDGFNVSYFHGGLESEEKIKQQNEFMLGESKIMVATSAFGMGVDKKDIGCIIHFNISDSLENYVQESGRAGRDENINANCYVLYNEEDLNKHFELLNLSKLNHDEIQQVWKAIKEMTKLKDTVSQSALEIARQAGWDENIYDVQTRITTAIAALEDSGYLQRGLNSPRIYANSILSKNVIEANQKIDSSELFSDENRVISKRIISKLISSKYKLRGDTETPEMRIDYISDDLGIPKENVIRCVNLLREIGVLSDDKDLDVHIKSTTKINQATKNLSIYMNLMFFIVDILSEDPQILNIKFLNESAIKKEIESSVKLLKTVINYMEITKLIQFNIESRETLRLSLLNKKDYLKRQLDKFSNVSEKILRYLYDKSTQKKSNQELITISFSVLELKNQYEKTKSLIDEETSLDEIESCIYMLQRFGIIHVEGGFLVTYSPMSIKRIIKDNYKKYTKADYSKLETFYKSKMQQIHIVGEYAAKMVKDYQSALQFVQDYFTFDYQDFLNKYFTGQRKRDINHNLSPKRFKQLFGSLTTEQLNVILDKDHKRIAVAAGPGSGKTKLLVHKLASIIYTEDIRQEQLLMLTFSRAAVIEFKNRLFDLIGPSAKYIDITTFHSFCFDILGQVGDLEKTKFIIKEAAELIEKYEADPMKITRSVLVIDEAQDINEDEYNLIQKLIQYNEGLRVIAVGDDDQNIFEFRGSSSKYFRQIASEEGAFYELPINFRSKKNIVDFANVFTKHMKERLKRQPIRSYTNDMGKIKIHYYKDTNLIVPLVNDVINTTLEGTKCIITPTNEQAYHITGLLNKHGFPAQLIQDFSYLKLFNILEMRYFYNLLTELQSPIISDVQLNSALDIFRNKFSLSTNYQVCLQALDVFKNTVNIQIYLTDFLQFLYESNLSDFNHDSNILVSTFHKAKGKEFDQVFILLDSISSIDEKELRKIYVGLTRAKTYLNIHTTSKIFNKVNTDQTEKYTHEEIYDQPDRLVFFLAHDDVNLGYFKFVQKNLKNLLPGAKLDIVEDKLIFHEKKIIRLSKKGLKYLNDTIESGYELTAVFLEHVLYWKDRLEEKEYLVALPKLIFDKKKEIED